jgi:sporadic carbohydrate cluster protein (TIGR04323 family)
MKLLKLPKSSSYIVNKPFGGYYLPARFQYLILRDYCAKKKIEFSLPQGEPVFSKTNIRLRSIIKKLKKNDKLIILSIYVLPEDFKIRSIIVKELVKKKIETHFVFENIVANKSNNYIQVMNIFKLNKFLRRKTD